ncbi:ABC transporter permease subunit [Streptomyces sp. RB6PN25]|uniref:ABC transporter permease subunit n=1 Tax=Streptomyces humicola TaxID=2953240 RepID=A0ABT1PRY4_9ACTN|nr:ABC transporter permease [Streptomyces humicola]MCQ4080428.1 ABC transporter permease subunit [Streptomyces humicola]
MTTPYQATPYQAYASPIPVQSTGLGHALRSEWTKIRTVRSTMWTLGVMLVLVIGIGLLVASLVSSHTPTGTPVLAFGFFGVLLGSLPVITLGVLVISSEYSTGMIRTTLTACPSRSRVLAAKAIVFALIAFVLSTLACLIVAGADAGMITGSGIPSPSGSQWLRATVGAGLYVALLGLLALAVGAMLRHSAGAITAMLGVVLLPLLLALFMATQSLATVRTKLIEYSVPNAIATLYGIPMLSTGPQGWTPLWILAGVTAVALAGALFVINKRDV